MATESAPQTETGTTASADSQVPAGTVEDSTETPGVSTSTEESPDGEGKLSFDDVPKEYRSHVEKAAKKYELDFKRTYTRKFQELSAKEKQRDYEMSQLRSQLTQFQGIARDVLQDPSKLDAYRKVYGVQTQAEPETPQFDTVGDLLSYMDKKNKAQVEMAEKKAREAALAAIQEHQSIQRWESALDKLRNQDAKFKKYENIIVQFAKDNEKYRSTYTGANEYDVLQMALVDFKGMLNEDLEAIKQETLAGLKKKKESTTAIPKKSVATNPLSGGLSPDEVIERVRARLGAGG